jgi:hypothetical protein
VGNLDRECQRQRARSGSQVHRDGLRRCNGSQAVDRKLRDGLGLWPRHEDAGTHRKLERPERSPAGDVLERLARRAALDEPAEPDREIGLDRSPRQSECLNPSPTRSEQVTEQ